MLSFRSYIAPLAATLLLVSAAAFAPESRDALVRQVQQRLTCAQHLFAADKQAEVSQLLFGERSSVTEAPDLQRVVGEILDSEGDLRFQGSELQAFRGWHRLHGQARLSAIAVATPFWVRNAAAFVRNAQMWSGVQKAAVFRVLANAIRLRNTPSDRNLEPMWNVAVHLSRDGDYVFHGPRHRLVIFDLPSPDAQVVSSPIRADELQFHVWPHTTAGTLAEYYRTQSYRPLRLQRGAKQAPLQGEHAAIQFILDLLGIRTGPFHLEIYLLPQPPDDPIRP